MEGTIKRHLARGSKAISHLIDYYWQLSAQSKIHIPDYLVPNGSLQLVFVLTNQFLFDDLTRPVQTINVGTYFFGHHRKAFAVIPGQGFEMFAIKFNSQGLHHLLRLPLTDFDEQHCLSADSVLRASFIKELKEKLLSVSCFKKRVMLTETAFQRYISLPRVEDNLMSIALQRIHQAHGQLPIAELAKQIFVTEKTLSRKFLEKIGVSPKTYAKNLRFGKAYQQLISGKYADLMEIALANGYYDRNHLLKDFQYYLENPPSRVVASGITNREDLLKHPEEL